MAVDRYQLFEGVHAARGQIEAARSLHARIEAAKKTRDAILDQVEREQRSLTPREIRRCESFNLDIAGLGAHIVELDEEIAALAERRGARRTPNLTTISGDGSDMPAISSPARVRSEPETYGKGSTHSYFSDLAMSLRENNPDANARLNRHAQELEVRAVNRTDGTGGYLVPPLWLVDEFIGPLRAGRVTADLCTSMALPPMTDSINVPKVTTGTAVAAQTADNAAVSSQDIADSSISLPVRTIAGQLDASLQLVEQSALSGGFDSLVFQDLTNDYNQKLDVQVLSGSGASGQVQGILGTAGITSVTYTDATPTVPELYLPLTQLFSQIASTRFLAPTAVVMHPRRWAWIMGALDTSNRPLAVPDAQGPNNAAGIIARPGAQGEVGSIAGLPVYLDANIPTNLGAGVNEDRIVMAKFDDNLLMEGELRTRALTEILSGTLGVRFQLYRYAAFTASRYALSNGVVSGTGLIGPSGY